MSKTSSSVKRKYNKSAYKRYEFSVNIDSKLNYMLEQYKANLDNNLSGLIKDLLCQHFNILDPTELYIPYHIN